MSDPTSPLPAGYAVDPPLEPGHQVGEFVVDGKLGEGAFGIVFRAAHPVIGKVVAVKVLARKFSVDPEMVSRFIAEARAVNQIRHRNIIDIFSFGQLADGRQYYVMEYLDGQPLDALLDRLSATRGVAARPGEAGACGRTGKLALAEALPILRGIARALDAAHAKGIAHRDLKAENVFLATDADGAVFPKLLDFGIAKLMAPEDGIKHKTRTGTPVGTPYYMSPEQCRGRDVDHRTDIYAFGVLAYLMLTGQYPHDADDYMSILMRQLTEEPSAPSTLAPELPPAIDDAIAWLLKKDPADRPPTLRAGLGAIEAAAEHAGIAVATAVWDAATGPVGRVDSTQGVPAARASSSSLRPGSKLAQQETLPVPTEPVRARPARRLVAIALGMLALAAVVGAVVVQPWVTPADRPPQKTLVVSVPAVVDAQPAPRPVPVPVEAQTVIVTVEGPPDGTEVFVAGMTAGTAPGPVQLPRDSAPVVLTFKIDGFLPTSRTVTPDRDQKLVVSLKKKPVGVRPRGKPGKDDIIDIFEKQKP